MNLSDLADDGDLPDFPAKPAAQPRDPATQRFTPKQPTTQQPEQAKPAAPAHSPYFETTARQFGFSDADLLATPPAVLERVVAQLQAHKAPSPKAEEPPAKPVEPLFDWGTGADGKPLTEEQAKERYDPPVFRAIKAANEVEVLKKENAELKAGFERDRQERSQRAALKQINAVFASRPDLFGKNPGEAKPGTPEAARYRAAVRHIEDLLAAKQHTTPKQDAEAALQLWGPAPKGKAKPAGESNDSHRLAQYQDGELATPTLRRSGDAPLSYRDRLVQKHRDAAIANGAVPSASWDEDDDSDLPD